MADQFSGGSAAVAAARANRVELILAVIDQILADAKGPAGARGPQGPSGVPVALGDLPVVTGVLGSATTVAELKGVLQSLMSALAGKYRLVVDSTT